MSLVFVANGSAAVPYHFSGVANYQFGGPPAATFHFGPAGAPDTSFVVITNNGTSTFTGNIGFNAVSSGGVDFSASHAVTLAPGQSASVSINNEASNQGGYNGPFDDPTTPQEGAEFFMSGTITLGPDTDPFGRLLPDRDIHSHVFKTNKFGVTLDNYILQGGDPFGRDTEDAFEVAQAPASFEFVSVTDFRGVRRATDINVGPDLCGTGQPSLNFTGGAGSASDTWIAVYDPIPGPGVTVFGSVSVDADLLFQKFNDSKGAGPLALFNEAPGKQGLALVVINKGNTDVLALATVDQQGKRTVLAAVSLASGIHQCVWYRVTMDVVVSGANVSVTGNVYEHVTPSDPGSGLGSQVGDTLSFTGPRPTGVDATGEVGLVGTATSAFANSSVSDVIIEP